MKVHAFSAFNIPTAKMSKCRFSHLISVKITFLERQPNYYSKWTIIILPHFNVMAISVTQTSINIGSVRHKMSRSLVGMSHFLMREATRVTGENPWSHIAINWNQLTSVMVEEEVWLVTTTPAWLSMEYSTGFSQRVTDLVNNLIQQVSDVVLLITSDILCLASA